MAGIITASPEFPFLVRRVEKKLLSRDGELRLESNGLYVLLELAKPDQWSELTEPKGDVRLALFKFNSSRGFAFIEFLKGKMMNNNGNPPFETNRRLEVIVEGKEIVDGRRIEVVRFSME